MRFVKLHDASGEPVWFNLALVQAMHRGMNLTTLRFHENEPEMGPWRVRETPEEILRCRSAE